MILSVLVPVFNEALTIERAVRRVRAMEHETQIICVDDASTDGTIEILKRLQGDGLIDVVVLQERNQGKGTAVRTALTHALGEFVVIQDADLEYDPADLPRLLVPLLDGRADAVFGSRFRGETTRVLYYWHSVGNRLLTVFSNMFANVNLTDMETCYKVMVRSVASRLDLQSKDFGIEPEITQKVAAMRARIYEVPISYHGRTYEEGKKIGLKDGFKAVYTIVRFWGWTPK